MSCTSFSRNIPNGFELLGGARHSRGVHGWLAPIFSKAVLFILVAVLIQSASAQVGAAISGRVVDATGAGVEDATVTIKSVETGATRTVMSDVSGNYRISQLPLGAQEVRAEKAMFKATVRSGVDLAVGQDAVVNLTLEVGSVSESVTVAERASLLETRSSDASQLVESKTIEDMPLGDRRAMNLIEITGAAVSGISSSSSTKIAPLALSDSTT